MEPMDVKIAGFWELGWNTPIKEIDLWQYPLQDFGLTELYMTPVTGIDSKFVNEYKTMDQIIQEHADYTPVICDERSDTPLQGFHHPDKALYIFGKANFSPLINYKREHAVKIETIKEGGRLWPHQAASIVLHDRLLKTQNLTQNK